MAQRGRPPSQDPKTERLFIRVSPPEKFEIMSFSAKTGFSLLELLKLGIETAKEK